MFAGRALESIEVGRPVLDDPKDLFGGTLAGSQGVMRPRKRKTA